MGKRMESGSPGVPYPERDCRDFKLLHVDLREVVVTATSIILKESFTSLLT